MHFNPSYSTKAINYSDCKIIKVIIHSTRCVWLSWRLLRPIAQVQCVIPCVHSPPHQIRISIEISNLLRGAREDPKIPPPPLLTVVFPFGYHGGLSPIINNISGSIWAHNIINNLFDGSDSILYCPGIRPPPSISPCPVIGRKIRLRRFYLLE